jgi:NAD(P)-dependent dehydrogenase (short-subunit alcohol dehydrogenase family)
MSKSEWSANSIEDQSGRIVVITGATSGIGQESARVLAGKRASVIIGARNMQKAEQVIAGIREEFPKADISARQLDLSDLGSVNSFADSIVADFDQLDVLINNAGIMMCPYSKTSDGFEIQMGTNHLGHFALTGRLLPMLRETEDSRIVVVASMAHKFGKIDLDDLNWETRKYDTNRAYGDSKLANLYFAYELARKLESNANNPRVAAAHPGWTATDLQRHSGFFEFMNKFFAQGPHMGALPTLRAGFDHGVKSGDYFGPCGFMEMRGAPVKVKSNPRSHDGEAARLLWKKSEEMTGIGY